MINIQWNLDFLNFLGKRKLVQIIDRFKKSGVIKGKGSQLWLELSEVSGN